MPIPDKGLSSTRFWVKHGCDERGNGCAIGQSGGPGESCPERGCAPPIDSKFEVRSRRDLGETSALDLGALPFDAISRRCFGDISAQASFGCLLDDTSKCAVNPSAPSERLGPVDWWDVSQVSAISLP